MLGEAPFHLLPRKLIHMSRPLSRVVLALLVPLALVLSGTGLSVAESTQVQRAAKTTVRPGRPVIVTAVARSHRLTIRWTRPAARGSSPITAYRVWRNGRDKMRKVFVVPARTR